VWCGVVWCGVFCGNGMRVARRAGHIYIYTGIYIYIYSVFKMFGTEVVRDEYGI